MAEAEDVGYVVVEVGVDRGRGVVATRTYRAEETVLTECPLVSSQFVWNKCYDYKACHMCMEPLETAQENVERLTDNRKHHIVLPDTDKLCVTRPNFHVVCPQCGDAVFCSNTCMEEAASSFHAYLCPLQSMARMDDRHPLNVVHEVWRQSHFPPETTSITLVLRILASIAQTSEEERQTVLNNYLGMVHNNIEGDMTHKLLGPQFEMLIHQLRVLVLELFPQPFLSPLLSPEGFCSLLSLIGRNGQGVGTSAFAVYARNALKSSKKSDYEPLVDAVYDAMEEHVGMQFIDNEGSGLYLMQSMFNHSCEPNAKVHFPFNNHKLAVNTLSSVEGGQEICISYLNGCDLNRSRHSRRKILRENYLFECNCPRCVREQSEQDDVTSEEEMDDDYDSDEYEDSE